MWIRVPRDTPLEEMCELWSLIRKKGLQRKEMVNLCAKIWPRFKIDWPKEGSFEATDTAKVNLVIEQRGLWKHKPYILLWDEVSHNEQFHAAKQMVCRTKLRLREDQFEETMLVTQRSQSLPQRPAQPQTTPKVERENWRELRSAGIIQPGTPLAMKWSIQYIQAPLRAVPMSTPTGVVNKKVYPPFTTSDLLNWQEKTPCLHDDMEKVYQWFKTIFQLQTNMG